MTRHSKQLLLKDVGRSGRALAMALLALIAMALSVTVVVVGVAVANAALGPGPPARNPAALVLIALLVGMLALATMGAFRMMGRLAREGQPNERTMVVPVPFTRGLGACMLASVVVLYLMGLMSKALAAGPAVLALQMIALPSLLGDKAKAGSRERPGEDAPVEGRASDLPAEPAEGGPVSPGNGPSNLQVDLPPVHPE